MVWLPQVETFVRSIAQGSLPLWDPFAGFGRPLLADPRAEILYPLSWLNLVMPPGTYYTLFVVIHLSLSGLGLFLLARRWGVSPAGAFVAGAVWIASGPFLSLVSMWHHLAGAAWIPWIVLAADVALDSGRAAHTLLWGATLGGQILAGSPDLTVLTLLILAPYVLVRRPSWGMGAGPLMRGPLAVGARALLFGLGLSAIQWLPTLDWALRSNRPDLPYGDRTTWSLHPAALLEVVVPLSWSSFPLRAPLQAFTDFKEPWLHSIHLGVPALALATAGLLSVRPRRVFLLAVAVGAVLFSLGRHSVAYDAATTLLPPLRILRFPVKAMVLAAFAWSLLAGMGMDVWRRGQERSRAWALLVVGSAVLALVLGLVGTLLTAYRAEQWGAALLSPALHATFGGILAPLVTGFALTAAFAGGVLVLALARGPRPSQTWALGALAVGSLLAAHRDLHWTAHDELLTLRPPVLALLERSGFPRLYVYDYSILTGASLQATPRAAEAYRLARIPPGWDLGEALVLGVHMYLNPPTAARWGLAGSFDRDILGFDPLPLAELNKMLRSREGTPAHLRLLQAGGVRNVLALTPATWWKELVPVAAVDGLFERPIQVFGVPHTLPRTYVVSGARLADGEAAQEVLTDPGFDPTREVVLPQGAARVATTTNPGTSRIVDLRPDRVRLEAELAEPGYVVLLDAYDPGWRATVDGTAATVLRANVAFRAVSASKGKHVIEMLYRPRAVTQGLLLSLSAIAVAGVWWLARAGREAG